jgi:hypothetical protein
MSERQPRSDISRMARPAGPDERRPLDISELSRYDLLLATIPLLLLGGWLVGQVTNIPIWAALAVSAFAVLPLVADGLAVNPPR